MPEISVIVPVYKVEKYIRRCVDSILAQTFTDFELILIDDGSPDNSGSICDEYVTRDARVQVIHKENGGVSSARNVGIDAANGNWITFVDSDDYVKETYLEDLYEPEYDVVVTGHKIIDVDTNKSYDLRINKEEFFNIEADTISAIMDSNGNTWLYLMTSHLFKKSIIKKYDVIFDNKYCFREDSLFMVHYFVHCHSIIIKSCINYIYMRRNSGSLSTTYNIDFFESLYATDRIISELMSKRYDIDFSKFTTDEMCRLHASYLGEIAVDCSFSLSEKYKIFKYLFCNKYFSMAIDNADKYFEKVSFMYKKLLKIKSPLLMLVALWVRTKINKK